ncbi:MAG: 2,3-diaminopropionate biosynthesis protein SbnA [Proteobacteria bacterium]|nr:2,3-diaminopropionate biosynthesis protein SbnA [Pseudomonadota bacterium]
MHQNILETIGQTPLVRLRRVLGGDKIELFAKLEGFNPGGSSKDRAAFSILRSALQSGRMNRNTVVVESSSGNMGIAMAMACAYYQIRFICVVDPRINRQTVQIMKTYGAEIAMVTDPDPSTNEFLSARLNRVRALVADIRNSFWPNQYGNTENYRAHYRTTMEEIARELDGRIDVLFCATSTCGTIRGCAEYIREHELSTRVVAVDAVGSRIFAKTEGTRRIPGLGAGVKPPLCPYEYIDDTVHVTDLDCVRGCRELLRKEAILVGGSSGGVLSAVHKRLDRIKPGSTCVVIFPDRGERYLDTVFSDQWVERALGQKLRR